MDKKTPKKKRTTHRKPTQKELDWVDQLTQALRRVDPPPELVELARQEQRAAITRYLLRALQADRFDMPIEGVSVAKSGAPRVSRELACGLVAAMVVACEGTIHAGLDMLRGLPPDPTAEDAEAAAYVREMAAQMELPIPPAMQRKLP